jgi:succinoglycan biosynthesis protein ExoM
MRARCLESLAALIIPDDVAVSLVVVDNDPAGGARLTIAQFCARAPFPVYYVHEPRRGIAQARNAAISKALEFLPAWVAMFDDDQIVEPDCLTEALAAAERHRADVVSCRFQPIFPKPTPFWCVPDYFEEKHYDGRPLRQCGTGGVVFKSFLIEPDGLGLRFDEGLGLNGGEDTSFFSAAHRRGARIVASTHATVWEEIVPARMTWWWQCYRDYCNAAAALALRRRQSGSRGIPGRLWKAATRFIRAVAEAPLLPVYAAFSRPFFKYRALKIGKQVFWAAGIVAGVIGIVPQPYRHITGY